MSKKGLIAVALCCALLVGCGPAEPVVTQAPTQAPAQEGAMLGITVPETYDISDDRFAEIRGKLPVEISAIRVDKALQRIIFEGYEYECVFDCGT